MPNNERVREHSNTFTINKRGLEKMSNQPKSVEQLRKHLEANNIKYLIPSYVDMHGAPKTKMVPLAHLEKMLGGSEFFTG